MKCTASPLFSQEANAGFALLPNEYLGKLLDHGANSAYAIHLIAFKRLHGPGYTLNENQVAKHTDEGGLAIGERKFRGALALTKAQGLLERRKGGRRPDGRACFARERLLPANNEGHVRLPEQLVRSAGSKAVAFFAAVLLEPFPRYASDVAKRVGVSPKSPNTIARLVAAAREWGIEAERVEGGWLVARPGVDIGRFKNVAIQKVAVKNVATHSRMEEVHSTMQESPQSYQTVPPPPAAAPRHEEHLSRPLTDWKRAGCFELGLYELQNPLFARHCSLTEWRKILAREGAVPNTLTSQFAYTQAMEIVSELAEASEQSPRHILHGLAHEIHRRLRAGRAINSLAFIAMSLLKKAKDENNAWMFDIPSVLTAKTFDLGLSWAEHYLKIANDRGIETDNAELCSTIGIEELVQMIGPEGAELRVEQQIKTAGVLEAGEWVCGWSYFMNARRPVDQGLHTHDQEKARSHGVFQSRQWLFQEG